MKIDSNYKFNMQLLSYFKQKISGKTALLLSFLFVMFFSVNIYSFYFYSLNTSDKNIIVKINPGTSFKKIVHTLNNQHAISLPYGFELFVGMHGKRASLKAGEYNIEPNVTAKMLLDKMLAGEAVNRSFTIIEGWTVDDLINNIKNSEHFTHTLNENNILSIATKEFRDIKNPEGLFLPDTYNFVSGISDVDFLEHVHFKLVEQLDKAWENRAPNLIYKSKYEALIVASIIEKETCIKSEYNLVSAVLLNRLSKGMRLQMDPTVIYGAKKTYQGIITKAMLKADNIYNTYQNKGLPPTPISLPSLSALEAALHPSLSNALYFVANGEGGHVFSDNLSSHLQAVNKYRLLKSEQKS